MLTPVLGRRAATVEKRRITEEEQAARDAVKADRRIALEVANSKPKPSWHRPAAYLMGAKVTVDPDANLIYEPIAMPKVSIYLQSPLRGVFDN